MILLQVLNQIVHYVITTKLKRSNTFHIFLKNVEEALKFLAKDDQGFFMMYEQGDIDWAAHADHMDDMLGTMLDIDDSVKIIMDWIEANGGYEKNALYVTADHDHYLTLESHFPEALANLIIEGKSYMITPENNSNVNAWKSGINAGRHEDNSKTQTEHLNDFSTWTEDDIQHVAHFWGTRGAGGNGWGSHSHRPVPISYQGDDGCLKQFEGKGYQVLGKEVQGEDEMIDQVHIHACMMKHLFGLGLEELTEAPAVEEEVAVESPVKNKVWVAEMIDFVRDFFD